MASFEHKIIPVSLGFNGVEYDFTIESEKATKTMKDLEQEGWEFAGFWDNPELYISDSFSEEKVPLIKLAVFKRRTA